MSGPYRITAVAVENFKGIRRAEFIANRHVVAICGANGQGKTSILDGIFSTLCGAAASPPDPVHRGESGARAEVLIGADEPYLRVTRTWSHGGETTHLYLEKADGSRPRSPQALLDDLVGKIAFDPLAFTRADPKEQAATLRRVAGLDERFSAIDEEAEALADERKVVNREAASLKAVLSRFPADEELAAVPDEPVPIDEVRDAWERAVGIKTANDKVRRQAEDDRRRAREAADRAGQAEAVVERLRRELEEAEGRWVKAVQEENDAASAAAESRGLAEALIDPDVEGARAAIAGAESVNSAARCKREKAWSVTEWREAQGRADALTDRITALRDEKADLLAGATYPIEGLAVVGDEVHWNGVPLGQASTSERIRVGLAVAAAVNPQLRVAFVRDASLLDDESNEEVRRWAEENGFQVWCEFVGTKDVPNGIVIEAGRVVADPRRPDGPA